METTAGLAPAITGLQPAAFASWLRRHMAIPTSADLATSGVTSRCSTVELRDQMEPALGIEPRSARYECAALPLCYAGVAASAGFEPAILALTGRCATIAPRGNNFGAAGVTRTRFIPIKSRVLRPLQYQRHGAESTI